MVKSGAGHQRRRDGKFLNGVSAKPGDISYKLGRKIFWDAPSETIVDQKGHPDAEANALLGREYRKGYELPKVEPA